jgi:hypothetical protein
MDKIKISIAKNNNDEDILISDSLKGEEYFCYDCNGILIPKKGTQIRHHYAHKSKELCNGETWKHIYTKKILSKYIKTITFVTNCNCGTNCEILFDDNRFHTKEEFPFNEYKIDLGIVDINNNLFGAIEVFHTHKTTNTKIKNIIYNGIEYIEIHTSEVINKVKDLESGNTILLNCIKSTQCNECSDYPIRKHIYDFTQIYSEYFGDINISNSIIELHNLKITEILNSHIEFLKNIDHTHLNYDIIQENSEDDNIDEINKEDVILRLNTDIIAGSFTSNIFLQTLSSITKTIKCNWTYDDIDIWKYNGNGLVSHEKQHGIQYLLHNKYVKEILVEFESKKIKLNIIQTSHAKNMKELLYSFDIACCQVGYQNGIWYITPYALYALISGINIEDTTIHDIPVIIELIKRKPKKTKYRDIYSKCRETKKESKYNDLYDTYNDKQFDKYDEDNYMAHPILTNIYNAKKEIITLRNYSHNIKCNYNEKDDIKSRGAIWCNQDKTWSIPETVSVLDFGRHIYIKTNINLTPELDLEDSNKIYLFSLMEPLEYWALICLTSDHNQVYRRLCAELDNENIYIEDAQDLLYECRVEHDIIKELYNYQDGKDGGWGCTLENSGILCEVKNDLLNNKRVKKLLSYLRTVRRRNKYKERGFTFSSLEMLL